MTTPEEKRRVRLNHLSSRLQHAKGKISLERTIAWGELLWGCREKTMLEYLGVLERAGFIEIERERDRVRWVGAE